MGLRVVCNSSLAVEAVIFLIETVRLTSQSKRDCRKMATSGGTSSLRTVRVARRGLSARHSTIEQMGKERRGGEGAGGLRCNINSEDLEVVKAVPGIKFLLNETL